MDTDRIVALNDFAALINPYTGDVLGTQRAWPGAFSDFTGIVECEEGPFFLKAMRNQPGGRRDSIVREKIINPFIRSVAPELLWAAEDQEWIVLGFEVVEGRQVRLGPDSPDLPTIVNLLNRMGDLPELAHDWQDTRFDRYAASPEEAELFRGDALLHADITNTNILVADCAWAVDWGWPVRGAMWIDPAMLVVQLIAAGHSPASAESWVAQCATWAKADPRAVDAFAAACTRMWWQLALRRPDRLARKALAVAAEAWANHRGIEVR